MAGGQWRTSPIALTERQMKFLVSLAFPVVMLHLIDYTVQISEGACANRNLDAIDFFSGDSSVYNAYCSEGLSVKYYEILKNPEKHNLNSMPGLVQAVQYVLRAKPSALVMGGPPCSSYVWINSSTSKRTRQRPFGDCTRPYIRLANKLTCRWALLLILCAARSLFTITEQPNSSIMEYLPYITFIVRSFKKLGLFWGQTFLWMGAHGAKTWKPTKLWGTAPFARKLKVKVSKAMKRRIQRTSKEVQMVKISSAEGKRSVSGSTYLNRSAAYPKQFGKAVLKHHTKYLEKFGRARATPDVGEKAPMRAPYKWKHADLGEIKRFLQGEIARGAYCPILTYGLDD